MRIVYRIYLAFIVILSLTCYFFWMPRALFENQLNKGLYIIANLTIGNENLVAHLEPNRELVVVILLWTKWYKFDFEDMLTRLKLHCDIGQNSEYTKYLFTKNRNFMASAQAIIFHAQGMDLDRKDFPETHPKDQIWIFMLQESPMQTWIKNLSEYSDTFNWTMTYRRDSDVYFPYSEVIPLTESEKLTTNTSQLLGEESLHTKTNMVAWTATNCKTQSKRMELVKKLQTIIPVDIYGGCGTKKCFRPNWVDFWWTWSERSCYEGIAKSYKFYLSFENSLCVDYATEKLFNPLRFPKFNTLPVVFGMANYSAIAPPHSFIDANSFGSVEKLADYLMFLNRNNTEYLKYFEWKKNYKISEHATVGWCRLIKMLSRKNEFPKRSNFDVENWWLNAPGKDISPACVNPESFSPGMFSQ